ncbi:DUF2785 domain-containing protein [Alkalibacillus haloalkaliphilus]|uniref:DUF2785 domain-containing protein n=1 Tax=Alkalibacillus haloalkaliphilus TaxID=94136 RepID=UPI0029359FC0|nr:DUF2785 domain-containing protein [Alkalibacillus haloalkaliphilus]MDV2582319.1 DUF2785 domain-containing protein [Alkalibacillus haloalkaliphilus]
MLLDRMLQNIGSVDPELRDTLIYNNFGNLILGNHLSLQQVEHILNVCLDNLFWKIGEQSSDSVFTRSFSALVIALILNYDRQKQILSDQLIHYSIKSSIKYLKLEKDTRGYVTGKGWAHSVAHGADLLTEAIKHPHFKQALTSQCLASIKLCIFKENTSNTPYIDDEEERLVFVMEALKEKGITEQKVYAWVLEIKEQLDIIFHHEGHSLKFFHKRTQVVNFLRSFYFRLLYNNEWGQLRSNLVTVLSKLHKDLYN